MTRVYLDFAAAAPIDPQVSKTMRDFELKYFGNPSSLHREGQQARAEIDFARADIAKFLNCKPQEIIFTSGATEANNHAVKGIVSKAIFEWGMRPHVITTQLEHHSVYNVVKEMESRGVIDATFIKPSADGMIVPEDITKAIKENTVLVSVIFVSNEIGSVLPVREIGKMLAMVNDRQKHKIAFHIDAVQAAKFYNCNVEKLGCNLLTLSAHKLAGPKGIGCLYVKANTQPDNLMSGGTQEYGMRPGTQNTAGIIGFAKAVALLGSFEQREEAANEIRKLRDNLWMEIKDIPGLELNGPEGESRNPDNISLTLQDVDQDALMTALDLAGIAASTGSACVSGSTEPSHVIKALGKAASRNAAIIRLTLGKNTSEKEIDFAAKKLTAIIEQLRR